MENLKYFESGKVRTTFSLAVNRWDPKTKSEVADWFNIDVWDKQAEFAGEYIKKGIINDVKTGSDIENYDKQDD